MPTLSTLRLARSHSLFLWLLPGLLLFSRAIADTTVVLVGLLFLYRSYRQQDWAWLRQTWFQLALLFWGYLVLINLPMSVSPEQSLKNAFSFIRWPIFAMALAYWLLAERIQQWTLLKGLLFTCLFVIVDTGWQFVFGVDWFGIERFSDNRLTGPFRNPVPGTLMLRVWFIALFAVFFWQWMRCRSDRQVLIIPLLLFIVMSFTFITGERMALLLVLLGAMSILSALMMEAKPYRRQLFIGIVGMIMASGMLLLLSPEMMQRSVVSTGEKLVGFAGSDYGRVFSAAWQVWQAHVWLGAGFDTYQVVCEQMQLLASSGAQCTHPHNLYLELGAETGLVGVLLFLCMLAALYWAALRAVIQARSWLHMSLSLSVLTVSFWPLVGGISLLSNWVAALVWLGVGWVLAVSATPLQAPTRQTTDLTD